MPIAAGCYYFFHEAEDRKLRRPPMILLHGAGRNHLSWSPHIRRMDGEKIYALDLSGHGQSEGAGRQSIDEYADDVIAFMKELKIRAAVFVGISMGSAVALTLALKFPKKVKGLVLLGAGAKMRVASTILETAGNANTFEAAVNLIHEGCFSENASPNLIELSKRQMMEVRPPVLLGDFLACDQFDVADKLERLKTPTLLICGREDKMTPVKYSEFLREKIPNAQLHVVENAGHLVMAEQPETVADLTKKFMDNLPSRAPKKKADVLAQQK